MSQRRQGVLSCRTIRSAPWLGQLSWVLRVMPETKGVPLEEMEAKLGLTHDPNDQGDPLAAKGH